MSFANTVRKNLLHYPFVKSPSINLSLPTFWDEFYQEKQGTDKQTTTFEWFLNASTVGDIILDSHPLGKDSKVLHVGAGTSKVGPWLQENTQESCEVINVDFDAGSCQAMQTKYPHQQWIHCGIGSPQQPNEWDQSFDMVLDKGTMDAVIFGGLEPTLEYAVGVERVLKEGTESVLVQLTDDPPEAREELLRCIFPFSEWNLSCRTLLENGEETASSYNDGKCHYCYKIWRKHKI